MNWPEISLQLDAATSAVIERELLAARHAMKTICLKPGSDNKPAPLQFLASFWNARSTTPENEIRKAFAHYLSAITEKDSLKTYRLLLDEAAENFKNTLAEKISPETYARLKEHGIAALLASPHNDPMGAELQQLMAGLPPADATAVTNVGLPKAEDHHNKFSEYFCPLPFEFAQIDPLGQMYLCCPQTLPTAVGTLTETDLMDAWNSEKARDVRASILDGSFRHCSESTCGVLQSRNLPKKAAVTNPQHRHIIDNNITRLDNGPLTINMSYDRSCNLSCPSCRKNMIVLKGKSRERAEVIHHRVINSPLNNAERLIITGSGDPFGSRLFFSFLKDFDPATAPQLKISLSSNGLLFTQKTWEAICNTAIDRVDISVDAASPATYLLNRGGDYGTLVKNLQFIGGLRASGKLQSFELHFVVQANNFREMKSFVQLGLEVHADHICFKQLVNWGTYSEQEYLQRAVQLPSHPQHEEFISVLADDIFSLPKVYIHDLHHLRTQHPQTA